MKLGDVKFITVIKYDELSVKGLYPQFLTLTGMVQYFPTKYPKGRQCDREYMWNVANSLHPDIVKQIIEGAITKRHDVSSIRIKDESITMSDHWAQELNQLPIAGKYVILFYLLITYYRKKGRMVALLKAKSKVILNQKSRKKYEVADVFKHRKVSNVNHDGRITSN